ncbi:glutamate cyclase domain-containing protein [Paenibacillus macerans]|uniref:glutamate cyclase domain-containing protein n=1 Tax=Paenibacillus macerans TaxID=44252 RepID=UPI003D31A9B9
MDTEFEKNLHKHGDSLDRLVSIDIHHRGVVHELYRSARELEEGPLTSTAALALYRRVKPRRPVFFLAGFPSMTWLFEGIGETDGPAGSAVLARVLEQTKQAIPVIITAKPYMAIMEAALQAAGLVVTDLRTAMFSKQDEDSAPVAAVQSFPTNLEEAAAEAERLFRDYEPAAVVAVEMPGRGKDGNYHSFKGRIIPAHMVAQGEVLFAYARMKRILTIGFGDGGNELGMGKLASTTSRVVPHGEKISCVTPADITVVASISNWGAYAVAAVLAVAERQPRVFQDIDIPRIIERIVDAGGVDGRTNRPVLKEDGVSLSSTRSVCRLIHDLLSNGERAGQSFQTAD